MMRVRNVVSLAWGMAIGCLTFAAGPIGWASANPIVAAIQWALLILITPGIIGGGAVGGSMHTIFLGVAASINAVLHFGICWLLFPLFSRSSLKKTRAKAVTVVAAIGLGAICLQGQSPEVDSFQNAIRLLKTGHLAGAELDFRKVVSHDPSNVAAQMYLGQTLFREQKFSDAIAPYEKVRDLEKAGAKLTLTQHRILGDQLADLSPVFRTGPSTIFVFRRVRGDVEEQAHGGAYDFCAEAGGGWPQGRGRGAGSWGVQAHDVCVEGYADKPKLGSNLGPIAAENPAFRSN